MLSEMPRIELERYEADEDREIVAHESFDRIAFAERAVALVRPPETTVAVCEGRRRVRVESGRQWGGAPAARWAILAVPRHASRRAILNAVLTLAADDPSRLRETASQACAGQPYRAWTLDVLLGVCE
jgi:hypothetical protein